MKELRYKVLNIYYDNSIGIQKMLVEDLKTNEEINISFDEDLNLILSKYIDKQDMYLAYIDYVEKHELNYYYRQLKLETVPKKYLQMYYHFDKYYKESYNIEVNQKIENIIKELNEIKEFLDIKEESVEKYYNKLSRINTAEFELNKVKKLNK